MTQSGGARNTFFLVTLYNFQKSGRAIALPAPPSPDPCPENNTDNIFVNFKDNEQINY